ncbi:uncharacterized protein M421DRAFT_424124 [Didymella exigua CBS 183.55]|uniref:Uncharacterized protein n=1 Tax=Didymella exigua CBS 183.55 TaxID=1150837 RepID=A0A6A5RBS6_9PLEO|nr:uncharacterized protein M421DRAFT_424124 [Didymella exigua CBS 183.55]KAF1925102.1 hypothetical protein M421DRAFT_424124 [Didymella exigua CBS 183.55]
MAPGDVPGLMQRRTPTSSVSTFTRELERETSTPCSWPITARSSPKYLLCTSEPHGESVGAGFCC